MDNIKKSILYLGWIFWVLTVTVLIYFFWVGRISPSGDQRQAIVLTQAEKEFVLIEMRLLLNILSDTAGYLGSDDRNKAALKAREGGMDLVNSLAAAEKTILLKLPVEFKKLGMATHDGLDQFAESIQKGKSSIELWKQLHGLTSKCVSCHSTYKIEVGK